MNTTQRTHMEQHLAILGDMRHYCVLNTTYTWHDDRQLYAPSKVHATFLPKKDVIPWIDTHNKRDSQCWISLNRKEEDSIDGVTHIQCIWVDVDATRSSKTKRATAAESITALAKCCAFQRYMRDTYGVTGFTACSGNGYHVYYPVEPYHVARAYRRNFNDKHRMFLNQMRLDSGIDIDTTTDIRRVTQPIGALNLKLPTEPLRTHWIDDHISEEQITHARYNNAELLERIQETGYAGLPKEREVKEPRDHDVQTPDKTLIHKLETVMALDTKIADLYNGYWDHFPEYATGKRSAAELALVTLLCRHGFTKDDVRSVMPNAKIGKWNELRDDNYRDRTIQRAFI